MILVQIHICGYIFLHPSPQGFQTLINQAKCLHLNNVYLQIIWKYDRLHFLHRLKRINVTILQIMDHNDWLTSYGSSHNILKYFIFICGLYPFFHLDKNQITLSSHHNLQAVWRMSYYVSTMSNWVPALMFYVPSSFNSVSLCSVNVQLRSYMSHYVQTMSR